MAEESGGDYGREVRGTVVKSTLTGVGLTVLAVTVFSDAGLGGMIGTSMASAFGGDHAASATNDPYANLPPYPSPLTQTEISDIRGQLAATAASLEITRAATEDKIQQMQLLAEHPGALAVPPAQHFAKIAAAPHVAAVAPIAPVTAAAAPAAPVETAAVVAPTETVPVAEPVTPAPIAPVSYSSRDPQLRDSHLEFAALLFGAE